MKTKFVSLSPEEAPILPTGHHLVLNIDERIVTLLVLGQISAQSQFSRNAFRLLFLLLNAPYGAGYAELLACLHCSESIFKKLLGASSYEQMVEILAPQVEIWSTHLARIAIRGKLALEKELKTVRRAVKERHGANTVLKENGFALKIKVVYREGYIISLYKEPRT